MLATLWFEICYCYYKIKWIFFLPYDDVVSLLIHPCIISLLIHVYLLIHYEAKLWEMMRESDEETESYQNSLLSNLNVLLIYTIGYPFFYNTSPCSRQAGRANYGYEVGERDLLKRLDVCVPFLLLFVFIFVVCLGVW